MISRTPLGRAATATAVLLSSAALAQACTGDIGSSLDSTVSSSGSGTESGAGGATSAAGGFDPTTTGGGGKGFEECQGIENEATLIPVSMFLQIDKSGSMAQNGKWSNAKAAFLQFFSDPAAQKGLNVAMRFWPDGGCEPFACNIDSCAQPEVPLGPLADPAHVQALTNSFNSKGPNGLTPMSAALAGATKWAIQQQSQGEGKEKVVVVFLTDGEPTACDLNINSIANIADDAFKKKEILTFAVGLEGSNINQMNTIAQGGHTDKAFFIGNGNAQADLLAALKKIQESVLSCTYAMPESPDPNQTIDPNQVNIDFTPGDGTPKMTLNQVTDPSKCDAAGTSWYYDDPAFPQAIILCPETCTKVQSDDKAKIKVVLGCATQAK